MRIFEHHKLLRKKNMRKFERKLLQFKNEYTQGEIDRERIVASFQEWLAYAAQADTYKYQRHLVRCFNQWFPEFPKPQQKPAHASEKSPVQPAITVQNTTPLSPPDKKKSTALEQKIQSSLSPYTTQKTLQLFKKGLSVAKIAKQRGVKETTVWAHLANLIEHNQLSLGKVIPREKSYKILACVYSENDRLQVIKERLNDKTITYDEISCAFASYKYHNKKHLIAKIIKWYRMTYCYRKCHKGQQMLCGAKFEQFIKQHPELSMNHRGLKPAVSF